MALEVAASKPCGWWDIIRSLKEGKDATSKCEDVLSG